MESDIPPESKLTPGDLVQLIEGLAASEGVPVAELFTRVLRRDKDSGSEQTNAQQPAPQQKVPASTTFRRKAGTGKACNLYFRDRQLIEAYSEAIRMRVIRSRSISSAVEKLIRADLRRVEHKLWKAGIKVPDSLREK